MLKRGLSSVALAVLAAGCTNFGDANPSAIYNEVFLDTYSATFVASTPDSATATFPDRWIVVSGAAGTHLARLTNAKVTLFRTTDQSGAPVWAGTLEGILSGEGYKTLPGGDDGLKFEIILRNAAGGETGSWITSVRPLSCEVTQLHLNESKQFPINIISPTVRAGIDVSMVKWDKCPSKT